MVSSLVDQVFKNKQSQVMVKEPNQNLMVKERYRDSYPDNEYSDLIRGASEEHEVPYELLYKLLETESQFNPQAKSPAGALGIAQFMPETAKSLGIDPMDPSSAVPGAAKYLKQHYDRFGSWKNALAAYNAGQGNVKKYGGVPPFEETQNYIKKVYNEEWDQPKNQAGVQGSLVDQIFKGKKQTSESEVIDETVPTTQIPIEVVEKPFNPRELTNSWFKNMYGVSADELEDRPESDSVERFNKSLSHIYSDLQVLKGRPDYVVKGIVDFALSLPGFGVGLIDAGVAGIREVISQVALEDTHRVTEVGDETLRARIPTVNLEEAYNAASEAMMRSMEFFEKPKEILMGEIPEESKLIGEVFMAPMTGISMVAHEVAEWPRFKDSPNIRGAAKFLGDITGMLAMGAILHGPSRKAEVGRKVEEVVNEGKKIIEKEKQVEAIPNEVIKQAQQKVLEVEKRQLELKAKEIADSISKDAVIREDMMWQAEQVAKEKIRPVVGKAEEVFVSKRGNRYKKIDGKWHDSDGQVVTNQFVIKAAEKGKETTVKEVDEAIGLRDSQATKTRKAFTDDLEKPKPAEPIVEKKPKKAEPDRLKTKRSEEKEVEEPKVVTEVDRLTGTEVKGIEGELSPFLQDRAKTQEMAKVFAERGKTVTEDLEMFTQKVINDVNQWRHGLGEIDIEQAREGLSQLASRADELRGEFITGQDHLVWKDTVSEAAVWARRVKQEEGVGKDRLNLKRSEQPVVEGKKVLSDAERIQMIKQAWEKAQKGKESGEGSGSTAFDIGGATVQGVKEIIKGAKSVAKYMEEARAMKQFKPGEALRMIREEGIRGFVDKSGNIRREMLDQLDDEGYKIVQKMVLSKGSSSLSASMLRQMQKEVYGGLSGKEKRVLDTLLLARRIGDIAQYKAPGKFKYPKGLEPTNVAAYSELFGQIEKLSLERANEINKRAEAYFEWMKKPLKDMLESGLISEQEFKDLSSHNYRKLKLVEIFDRKRRALGKKGRTVYDSGVESLSRGRDTDIFEPSSEIMALEVFNRSYGRILNNEANKTLLDLARRDPENNFVRIKKEKGGTEGVERIPSGWHRSFVYEGGKRKTLWISPEMAKEWIISNPEISYKASQLLRWASGSPVLRTFATGIDWAFALANLPRDVMHVWYTARTFKDGKWEGVYSPHMPVYGLQIGADLARTFSDAFLRRGRYEDYINEGGGMEFLVHQGRLLQRGRHIGSKFDKIMDFLGFFGETTEIMTRLSIRDRVIRNKAKEKGISFEEAMKDKAIREEATFAARDYMDFGQGGTIAKAADNAFPYLNAAIQGTRGMLRSFKPGEGTALESTYKLAQFAALTTGTYIAFTHSAPKTMEDLKGDLVTQNNFVIPLGDEFSFEDEKGQTRYPYIKIPIDPSQKFFKTFFEAATDKMMGREVDVDRVVSTLKEQSPVGISTLPPSVSSVLGYAMNKDFWRNEDIWNRSEPFSYPRSQEEFIPGKTPQMFIDIGKATGLSPERTKYAVEELVTSGSIWTQLLMGGYEKAFSDLPKRNKEQHLAMTLARMPIAKRFIGVTNPYSKFADKIDKAEETAVLERFMENRGLDVLAEGQLFYDNVKASEIAKYMTSFKDVDTYDRLQERYDFYLATKDLPNRSFWLRLQGTSVDTRARVFVDRLKSSGPEQRQELFKELGIVSEAKGLISDEFMDEVFRLMGE